MRFSSRSFPVLLSLTGLFGYGTPSHSASILEYRLTESGSPVTQQLEIDNGRAWIRKLSGDPNTELLFDGQSGQWALIRHDRQTLMIFSEKSVRQLANQLEMLAPLVKGVGKQMNGLSQEQRLVWGHLLEKVPVDELTRLQQGAQKAKLTAVSKPHEVAGVSCHLFKVDAPPTKADLCMAEPSALSISAEDANTLSQMADSGKKMVNALGSLSAVLGFELATNDLAKVSGIPVSFHEGHPKPATDVTFLGAKPAEKPLKSPDIPANYRHEKFKPW